MNNRPIGVFDSGIGGITVYKEIRKLLPEESIIYYADTARVPYGPRPDKEIIEFSLEATDFLIKQDIKLLVIACNTVTAVAFDAISKNVEIPVIGVIDPGVRTVINSRGIDTLGLIATEATVKSGVYQRRFVEELPSLKVIAKACPMLVSIVEEGWANTDVSRLIIQKYLEDMMESGMDALILACTHFPVLRTQIQEYIGDEILIIDPAEETAKELSSLLTAKHMHKEEEKPTAIRFFVSDKPDKFKSIVDKIVDLEDLKIVSLNKKR